MVFLPPAEGLGSGQLSHTNAGDGQQVAVLFGVEDVTHWSMNSLETEIHLLPAETTSSSPPFFFWC